MEPPVTTPVQRTGARKRNAARKKNLRARRTRRPLKASPLARTASTSPGLLKDRTDAGRKGDALPGNPAGNLILAEPHQFNPPDRPVQAFLQKCGYPVSRAQDEPTEKCRKNQGNAAGGLEH